MDKFLIKSTSFDRLCGDNSESIKSGTGVSSKIRSVHNEMFDSWTARDMHELSTTHINCAEQRRANEQYNSVGWRVVNGVKTYSTFRNGKKVQATGSEGFKLSAADTKKKGTTSSTSSVKRGSTRETSLNSTAACDLTPAEGQRECVPISAAAPIEKRKRPGNKGGSGNACAGGALAEHDQHKKRARVNVNQCHDPRTNSQNVPPISIRSDGFQFTNHW